MALIEKYEEYLAEINRCIDENDLDKKRLGEAHSRIVRKIIGLRMKNNHINNINKNNINKNNIDKNDTEDNKNDTESASSDVANAYVIV